MIIPSKDLPQNDPEFDERVVNNEAEGLKTLQLMLDAMVDMFDDKKITLANFILTCECTKTTLYALQNVVQLLSEYEFDDESDRASASSASDVDGNSQCSLFRSTGPWVVQCLYTVVPHQSLVGNVYLHDLDCSWYSITCGRYVGITSNKAHLLAAISGVEEGRMAVFSRLGAALQQFNEVFAVGQVRIAT